MFTLMIVPPKFMFKPNYRTNCHASSQCRHVYTDGVTFNKLKC